MTAALFHGTRVGFGRGGYLFPASWHGKPVRAGNTAPEYAYATPDADLAEWYARQSKGRGRPKVLTVVPLGPVEIDPSPYDGEDDQVRCRDGFRVVAVRVLS